MSTGKSGRLALLVGGGPAPGINGVISAVTIEAVEQGMEVIGFLDGFKWLVEGNIEHLMRDLARSPAPMPPKGDTRVVRLEIDDVKRINLRGGSILRTSRTNPTKSDEMMRNVLEVFRKLGVTLLVTIGGDDTAYSGSQVCKRAGGAIRVAHVPKTIDNDLPLPGSTPTFGFETARQVGVRSEEHTSELQSRQYLVCRLLLEK